jgi:CRP/FNR family transcriptional regulator
VLIVSGGTAGVRLIYKEETAKLLVTPCHYCEVRDETFCGGLDIEELHGLDSIVTEVQLRPKQALFFEGDPAEYVFNVTQGTIRVVKYLADGRRQITGFLFPGDFLGLAHNGSYIYGAEAITSATLCQYREGQLQALIDESPRLARRLLAVTSNELFAAQDQMVLLGRKTAREKIASLLLTLVRRSERRGQPRDVVHMPIARSDLADYMGLTVESVSRTLSQMRKEGLIYYGAKKQVYLRRRQLLENLNKGL